jgi:DMSO reductase anchor subunit
MKPAFSVIFFTVSSGAGLGLIALLAFADLLEWNGTIGNDDVVIGGVLALLLTTAGLLSSTLHLANPKNAWRSFSRFRTSWLSREGVFAVLFYPFAVAYIVLAYFDIVGLWRVLAAACTLALAVTTLYCTGMIYASLKPIPQWNTPLVPIGYLVLGYYSGALLLLAILSYGDHANISYVHWALTLLVLAATVKAIYYAWIAKHDMTPTINTAIGISRARVRLLDAGHSHATFLTDEFGFSVARQYATWGKAFVFVLGFGLPLLILLRGAPGTGVAMLAIGAAAIGLLLERWFFFAEARHVVRLYHGL